MARYGPPDDPNNPDNQPTAYIDYGDQGPPTGEPVPWYRKPVALVAFGALGAVLVALIIFGLVKLVTGGSSPENSTTLTPITRSTTSVTAPTTTTAATTTEPPTTTEPTTTTTTTEPTTTTTTTTMTTTTESSVSTSVSTSTSTSTITQTVTVSPPAP